jgi:hypothetical protein
MKKYFDEKTFVTVLVALVVAFFLKAWLTKEIHNGSGIEVHLGTPATGYTKVA